MLDIELINELSDDWIKKVKDKAPFEEIPYTLWDRSEKIEVQMLRNPEIAKMINFCLIWLDLSA